MSYYRSGQTHPYQNSPPPPPQAYPNQYQSYPQPYHPIPNHDQDTQAHPGYPQAQEQQYAGQVSSPGHPQQGSNPSSHGYSSPQLQSSTGTFSPQQPSYSPSIPSYNPQHYASISQQQYQASHTVPTAPQSQNYNPQAYASPPQQYTPNPGHNPYADTRQHAVNQNRYGYTPSLSPSEFSTHSTFSPQVPHYSPPLPATPHIPSQPAEPSRPYTYSAAPTYPTQPPPLPYRNPDQHISSVSNSVSQRTAPYPQDERWVPSPPQGYSTAAQISPQIYHTVSNSSAPSSQSNTPGPTPPAHGTISRSNASLRHPQSRPLPGPPIANNGNDYFDQPEPHVNLTRSNTDALDQDELFSQVEDALVSAGNPRGNEQSSGVSFDRNSYQSSYGTNFTNGHFSPAAQSKGHLTDDSDAEAAQGLEMMRAAEEEDERRKSGGDQVRFASLATQIESQQQPNSPIALKGSDSEDYVGVDMTWLGGGSYVPLRYGDDLNQHRDGDVPNDSPEHNDFASQQSSVVRSSVSHSGRGRYSIPADDTVAYRPYNSEARVDAVGTGGFSEPTGYGRRQSYDEGDEDLSVEAHLPERFPDEPMDITFNAALTSFTSGRPLPPPPLEDVPLLDRSAVGLPSTSQEPRSGPESVVAGHVPDLAVPRSSSFVSHSNTPAVSQPLRSKTDAEERSRKQMQSQQQNPSRSSTYSPFEATAAGAAVLDLPSLGAKRFIPSKLGAPDFRKCAEPWGLSSIMKWLLIIISPEQYSELKEVDVSDALINLFTNKVPTMNIADAEGLANRVVQSMYQAGTLVSTEEWVKLVPGPMSGVIFQLTGTGCYASKLHDHIMPGRCYSHFCQRTLKKLNLSGKLRGSTDWAQFYNLERADWESKDKKELERQYILHEIVHTEDSYIDQLSILQTLYRDPLVKMDPSIISPSRKEKFIKEVFGRLDNVKQANLDHLLPQLKYRQQEQGPFISGFSDIFRQWIRKAKVAYLEYAAGFPSATFFVRSEIERNLEFRAFIDRASKDPKSMRLGWDTYLSAPITRLQRYSLLLATVMKNMLLDGEERRNLQIALDEVRSVTQECDARVAEMTRKVDLTNLGMKLKLRPGMQNAVELNLDHFGREVIYRGDLQRMGGNRFTWLDSHAILFDHYLVIAKTITQFSEQGGKVEKYDVSRLPIPMDLLILESANDTPVQKSSYVKGITSVSTVSGRTVGPTDPAVLSRASTGQSNVPVGLQHANTGNSSNSLQPVSSLDNRDSDRIMYPFKVKHLGRDTYTLFAPNESARNDWVTKIAEAKTKHAASLYAQHAEPFKLRVMADSAFVFDAFSQMGKGGAPVIKGTPIDRAVKEVEHRFRETGRPGPICRARVNCATTFTTPHPSRQIVAVGTDFGVFLSEVDNPRGWTKVISMSKVTQIAVLEEFNLFLLISEKVLIAYHLDVICPTERNGPTPVIDSARKAPQKLSGSKDVGFFVCGRMKDRTLVFYKKKENLASVFKVLEPIYQKSTEKKRGMFKRGTTDFFREYDEFYIPAESTGINLFHSSLAVSTARGFEVLTLDKKQPWSVPELRAEHVQNIASHIKDQKALGMLRLSDQEFLLCYSNCAVYVNKHGDVSRSVIMDFVGTAQSVALYGIYLILFDSDFVEIRNASNGRLKQIISGREIKCLDDGGNWSSSVSSNAMFTSTNLLIKEAYLNGGGPTTSNGGGNKTVKFVMQHPESEKTQLVVELLLNENMKE